MWKPRAIKVAPLASSPASRTSTGERRVSPKPLAVSAPSTTPATNELTRVRTVATAVQFRVAKPTPKRVELPLMNETKKPPSFKKPIAST